MIQKADGDYDGALQSLEKTASLYPRDRVVWNQIGRVLFLKRDYAGSEKALLNALSVDPEDLQAHYTLMLVYRGLGQAEKARREEVSPEEGRREEGGGEEGGPPETRSAQARSGPRARACCAILEQHAVLAVVERYRQQLRRHELTDGDLRCLAARIGGIGPHRSRNKLRDTSPARGRYHGPSRTNSAASFVTSGGER